MNKFLLQLKRLLISFALLWMAIPALATHYQGGDLTYEFLGIFNGQYRYRFQLDVYVNCLPTSSFPNGVVDNLNLCIYDAATNNLTTSRNLNNPVRQYVQPDLPPGCSVPIINQVLCSRLNRFTEIIDLPNPFSQYYAIHERCCRENAIDNLQNAGSTGNTFITEMAPNFVQNSSPQFQDIVIPFLCTGDTLTLSNNAIDPDGDFLVYKFVQPYDQFTGGTAPGCAPTYNNNAIPFAPYASGFSLQEPFGPGSYAFINAANGLTKYYTPNNGKYSLAVEIQEYRDINNDGIEDLIGTTYREIIFIAEACAANPTPTVSPITANGSPVPISGNTGDIDINEGESLTFTFTSNDPNNDSVYIEPSGSILDGSNGYTGPLATFPDVVGLGTASSTFNWQSACGFTGQFVLRIDIKDNGCPPKNDIYFLNINVRPFSAADQLFISDPGQSVDTICLDGISRNYFVTPNNGSVIQWSANGGTINGPANQASVDVTWNSAGLNTLTLIETSTLSCSDTSVFEVLVSVPDTVITIPDTTICFGQSVQLDATGSGGYLWSPNQFLTNNLIKDPISSPTSTITYFVQGQNNLGCAVGDSITIEVIQPFADAGPDQAFCSGDTVQLGNTQLPDKIYSWAEGANLNDSTLAQPVYTLLNPGLTAIIDTISLLVTDTTTGCSFTDEVTITINALPVANAGLNDTICSGESTNLGTGSPGPNTTCTWSGNFIGNPNSCSPLVTPVNGGTSNLTYQYTLLVQNNVTNCINRDTVEVLTKPLPPVNAGLDTTICKFQTIQLGSFPTPGVVYSWVSSAPGSPVSPTNSANPIQTLNSAGNWQSIVTAINTSPDNLCTNRDTINITVNDLPVINIVADTSICSQEGLNIGGLGVPNQTYAWSPSTGLSLSNVSNPVLFINNPTQATQTFTYQVVSQDTLTSCIDSASVDVDIRPLPIVDAGPDIDICSESSDTIGTAANPNYNSYTWNTSTDLNDSTIARPVVSPLTGNNPTQLQYDLLVEWNGCFDRDTVIVTVNPKPVVDTILGGVSICPDLQDVLYTVLDTIGFINFQWGINGGIIITPTNNDSILVDWGPLNPNASLYMIPTNAFNCTGDTTFLPIDINPVISSPPPVGPTDLCLSNATTVIYAVPYTTGYNYIWSAPAINHNLTPVGLGNQVAYDFLEPGVAQLYVEQQVTTPTSTCLGFSDTLEVTIHPDPDLSIPIVGDTSVCEFTNGLTYTINGFPNSSYQWSVIPGGAVNDTINSITIDWDSAGDYQVVVFETTEFGCTSGDVVLDVKINPIPETDFASVDTFVCAETTNGNTYVADGFANSSYVWDVIGGSFEQNDSSDTAIITWDPEQGILEVNVFEISEFNCTGAQITYSPTVDLSQPLVSNVTLIDPADTFSNVSVSFNKGLSFTNLVPDTLTLYRKTATSSNWTPIARVASSDTNYIDSENLNRIDNYYEYQVSSRNLCANEIFSPLHNTIKLEGEGIEDMDQLNLDWNEYINYLDGISQYEIYRRVDDEENFELYQSTGSPGYTDFSANDGFRHYFRIRALDGSGDYESWSNEFEVIFLNIAQVADVITPNGDGKNDTWKIDNIELYPGTEVKIFNRYGTEVYKTSDYKGDWAADGLPAGTYFFQAIFQHLEEPVGGYIEVLR